MSVRSVPRRIVLLARHFPPLVSAGSRRPYLLAKGLAELGVEVRLVCPVLPDEFGGVAVPHPQPEPATAPATQKGARTGLRNFVRSKLFLPDPDIRWSLRAAKAGQNLKAFTPDWVLSTSPPESIHVAGRLMARRLGCAWAADFRDSWLDEPLLEQRRHETRRSVERVLARHLLRRADLITAAEPFMLAEVGGYAPHVAAVHLPQPAPAIAAEGSGRPREDDTIEILHTGSFSLSHDQRRLQPVLDLFHSARRYDTRFRLVLRGRLTDEEQSAVFAAEGVETRPPASLNTVWCEQARADILLLVAAPEATSPPGKLAEYKAAGRPIVCLGGGVWRRDLPGHDQSPLARLLALRDPAARIEPAIGTTTPRAAAERLLDAMRMAVSG